MEIVAKKIHMFDHAEIDLKFFPIKKTYILKLISRSF